MRSSQLLRAMSHQAKGWVTLNDVSRDMSQGSYANRIPLDHPKLLEIFRRWNQLNKKGAAHFGCIEMGGASVQVDENFLRRPYTETARNVRKSAPDTVIRPLWRGANSFLLKPAHTDDLFWLLRQFAEDVASKSSDASEMLRIKVFDSQAVIAETASTLRMVARLREQGYPIGVEVAIPYSNGAGRAAVNPYPDSYFVKRMLDAVALANHLGLPSQAVRVSLKDMVGELSESTAGNIIGSAIERLRHIGASTEIGVHSHDTGFAFSACLEAAKIASRENWRINLDTVGGQQSGFVNTFALACALQESGIIELSADQRKILTDIDVLQDQLRAEYRAARAPEIFDGEDLRRYAIPGGGSASFIAAVRKAEFNRKLHLSFEDASHVLATALITVGRLMGHAFPVTPGFQNKQIAAFNLIDNMVSHHALPVGDRAAIERVLLASLSNEQVSQYFVANLNPVVKEFLRGEMPAAIHPVIREQLGRRNGLLTDNIPSQLPQAEAVVSQMQAEGLIQAGMASYREAVARALIVGHEHFREMVLDPCMGKEVNPTNFTTAAEWEAAKARTAVIRDAMIAEKVSSRDANRYAESGALCERHFGQAAPGSWKALVPR